MSREMKHTWHHLKGDMVTVPPDEKYANDPERLAKIKEHIAKVEEKNQQQAALIQELKLSVFGGTMTRHEYDQLMAKSRKSSVASASTTN